MPPYLRLSLLTEGLAVGTLIHGGICLVGTNQNALQRAEVGILAVMGTLLNSTLNALVCMTIHSLRSSISFVMGIDCPADAKTYISFCADD